MVYFLVEKIRSKIIFDVGKIFNVKSKDLLILAASVEAIHAYSLIHDDLPCMDDDKLRRRQALYSCKIW